MFQARFVSLVKGGACPGSPGPDGVLVPVLAGRSAGWLYVSQKELYLPVWAGISLLTLLPLLKKGRRGLLIPAVLLALTSRGFSGLLVYPRAYSLISQKVVVDKTNGLLSGNHIYFGQAGAELMVFAWCWPCSTWPAVFFP